MQSPIKTFEVGGPLAAESLYLGEERCCYSVIMVSMPSASCLSLDLAVLHHGSPAFSERLKRKRISSRSNSKE